MRNTTKQSREQTLTVSLVWQANTGSARSNLDTTRVMMHTVPLKYSVRTWSGRVMSPSAENVWNPATCMSLSLSSSFLDLFLGLYGKARRANVKDLQDLNESCMRFSNT